MTSPESGLPRDRFALLASGANFSCQVLQALRRKHYQPTLLVLPEYPPAKSMSDPDTEIVAAAPRRRFLELGQDIVIGYAPADRQAECASLIQQAAIDYILVACWPYLIGEALITSPTKAALNLHPSLLPDFRGPNPIEQQLARGMSRFGVTTHPPTPAAARSAIRSTQSRSVTLRKEKPMRSTTPGDSQPAPAPPRL